MIDLQGLSQKMKQAVVCADTMINAMKENNSWSCYPAVVITEYNGRGATIRGCFDSNSKAEKEAEIIAKQKKLAGNVGTTIHIYNGRYLRQYQQGEN